jgi:YARHG domain-containing protein
MTVGCRRRFSWLSVSLFLTSGAAAQSPVAWEKFDFAHARVDSAAIDHMSLLALRQLRGIVFGKHGRPFPDETDVQTYLKSRPWYRPDTTFTNARLNAREKANLDVIRGAEARKHTQIETGDMRYNQNRVVTTAMLGHHTAADWEVISSEIGAIHGQTFMDEEPDEEDYEGRDVWVLQKYFDDRYWYHRRKEYSNKELSAIERANADTIALARMRDLKLAVAPGTMYLFQTTALTDTLLRGVSLYELRILRNEVYARHGRRFETPWLRDYFKNEPWYTPRASFTIAELSENEKANIKVIQAVEARRHDELSTRELSNRDVDGLFPEIARRLRNEIFARHGRTFKDPHLQSYFASQDWYHPDPKFSLKSLSPIERKNVDFILAYEARAKEGMRFTEA